LVTALMAGGRAAMFDAQEGAEDSQQQGAEDLARHGCLPGDVVVGITASGRTPYVLGALEWARRRTIATIGIACNPDAPIKTWADVPILIDTGPEVIMGSTRLKAGTAQKMVLNMLSTGAMAKLGKTYRNLMVDMRPTNQKLKQRAVRIVALALEIEEAQAFGLLEAAQQDAKLAIAMGLLGCDASTARTALGSAQGRLHRLGRLRGGREDGI
jgi:N-acetylmuramic acid 6-phosphate etherase